MSPDRRRLALIVPSLAAIGALLVLPLCLMAYVSTLERGPDGGVVWHQHTLDAYTQFLFERDLADNLVINTDYLRIFARSFALAAMTATLTLAVAFPTALWMAFQPPSRRTLLLFLATVPFWTNLLVRNYSWILLLRTGGLLRLGGPQGRPAPRAVGFALHAGRDLHRPGLLVPALHDSADIRQP